MKFARLAAVAAFCAAVLVLSADTPAQEGNPGKDLAKVVEKGVEYLKTLQMQDGAWPREPLAGCTALAALTLLECGISPDDPCIRKAASALRKDVPDLHDTYSVSLAIMFLDLLGDPQDIPLIEVLGVRLLAGQNTYTGSWGYRSPPPDPGEAQRLAALIERRKEPEKLTPIHERKPQPPRKTTDLPRALRDKIKQVQARPYGIQGDYEDLSNTQFAALALWVARRHGVPIEKAVDRLEKRLRQTQRPSGGWSYRNPGAAPGGAVFGAEFYKATPAMTCAGLIGLSLPHGLAAEGKGTPRDLAKDTHVQAGLLALGAIIGKPTAPEKQPRPGHNDKTYYFLWTLERMAVLYGLDTIGEKDWFKWGVEVVTTTQQADGSWKGEYQEGGCDTCFALLFLRRANIARDLTVRLKGKQKDPGRPSPKLLEMIEKEFGPAAPKDKGKGKQSRLAPRLPRWGIPRALEARAGDRTPEAVCATLRA